MMQIIGREEGGREGGRSVLTNLDIYIYIYTMCMYTCIYMYIYIYVYIIYIYNYLTCRHMTGEGGREGGGCEGERGGRRRCEGGGMNYGRKICHHNRVQQPALSLLFITLPCSFMRGWTSLLWELRITKRQAGTT